MVQIWILKFDQCKNLVNEKIFIKLLHGSQWLNLMNLIVFQVIKYVQIKIEGVDF